MLGTLGALGLTCLRALLYGVTPTDRTAFVEVAAVMFAVAAAAAYLPAVRAASTDPMRVLRRFAHTSGHSGSRAGERLE